MKVKSVFCALSLVAFSGTVVADNIEVTDNPQLAYSLTVANGFSDFSQCMDKPMTIVEASSDKYKHSAALCDSDRVVDNQCMDDVVPYNARYPNAKKLIGTIITPNKGSNNGATLKTPETASELSEEEAVRILVESYVDVVKDCDALTIH